MRARELKALAKRLAGRPTIEQLRRVGDARYPPRRRYDPDAVTGLHAILVGHKVVKCNTMTWARWFEAASRLPGPNGSPTERHVGHDDCGFCVVSTVFLGMDHGWGWGQEQWFETMVFAKNPDDPNRLGRDLDGNRYTTYAEAEAGHAAVVNRIKEKPWMPRS